MGNSLTKEGIQPKFEVYDFAVDNVATASGKKTVKRLVPHLVTEEEIATGRSKQPWKYGPGILYGVANKERLERIRRGLEVQMS